MRLFICGQLKVLAQKGLFKIFMNMNLTAIFLMVLCFNVSAKSYSQGVSLSEKNVALEKIFSKINKQTGFTFVYTRSLLKSSKPVTINVQNASLSRALDLCFKEQPLSYTILNDMVIIKEKEQSVVTIANNTTPKSTGTTMVIKGKVTDDTGQPLEGATILVKGRNKGAKSDSNGNFSIEVELNATLIISYVGFETVEVKPGNNNNITIQLKPSASVSSEIVVVGYGTQKKRDLTGAVASVSNHELNAYPASSAVQALQGRAAGVAVQSVNGAPGQSFKIRVRGSTSINASSDPLIVVDGLVGGMMPPPQDIASIEVLKDASASAIYGSRAANGVVIVTSKSGKTGKTIVNLSSSYSLQHEIGRLHLLNSYDFSEYINEVRNSNFYNLDSIQTNTDWQSLVFQPGHIQNHQLSVSGGSDKIKYYMSGVYFGQKGIIKNSDYNRVSFTSNIKYDVGKRVHLNWYSIIENSKRKVVPTQTGGGALNEGVIEAAERFDPNLGIVDNNGVYTTSKVGIAAFANPMSVINGRQEDQTQDNIQSSIKATLDISKSLLFNSTFGVMIGNSRTGIYNSHISDIGINMNGSGGLSQLRNTNFLTEQYFNYNKKNVKNSLDFTAGYSYQQFKDESFSAANAGFITDALGYWNLGVGTNLQAPGSGYIESKITSFYGRANYNYDNRFLLTLTGRYDGASQFSEGNQWSFFPSGAFSWNIHHEKFYPQNNILSVFKLRTSYGLTGNQAIKPYQSLAGVVSTFFVLNNTSVSSVRPATIANKDLTWETTAQFDVGLDLGLLNGRISITGDYYNKRTHGLLFSVPVPSFSGYTNKLENLGEIENKGFEFQITSKNLVSTFK